MAKEQRKSILHKSLVDHFSQEKRKDPSRLLNFQSYDILSSLSNHDWNPRESSSDNSSSSAQSSESDQMEMNIREEPDDYFAKLDKSIQSSPGLYRPIQTPF